MSRRGPVGALAQALVGALVTGLLVLLAGPAGSTPGRAGEPRDPLQAALKEALAAQEFPSDLTPALGDVEAGTNQYFDEDRQCLGPRKIYDVHNCVIGGPKARRSVVVIGDSVSTSYLPGIVTALRPRGWRIHGIALHSCPTADVQVLLTFSAKDTARCNDGHRKIYAQVRRLRPDLVVIADSSAGINRLASGNRGSAAETEWTAGMKRAIRAVSGPGRRVVILAPNVLGLGPRQCITDESSTPADCVTRPQDFWYAKRNADTAAATATGATYVNTLTWFCYQRACPIFADGLSMRWDSAHLTGAYARMLASRFKTALLTTP